MPHPEETALPKKTLLFLVVPEHREAQKCLHFLQPHQLLPSLNPIPTSIPSTKALPAQKPIKQVIDTFQHDIHEQLVKTEMAVVDGSGQQTEEEDEQHAQD